MPTPARVLAWSSMSYLKERWWPGRIGLLAAAIVLVVGPPEAFGDGYSAHPYWHSLLTTLVAVCLFFRRVAPLPTLVVALVVVGLTNEFTGGEGTFAAIFAAAAATMNVGYEVRSRWSFTGVAVVLGMSFALPLINIGADVNLIDVVAITVLYGGILIVGWLFRQRNEQAIALRALAAQLAHERELHTRQAVEEERARIARELHDIVSHSISLVVIQLQAVRRKLGTSNPEAADDLRQVETVGRQAMAEMRRMLGVLRVQGAALELEPQPGLSQLPRLLAQTRAAGLKVEFVGEGEEVPLPPGVDLAAYRVVQEALTNVLKHAKATTATVTVRYGDRDIGITVSDDGRGPATTRDGRNGLLGMRERVTIYGGTLTFGAGSPGGFRLDAYLPVREEALRD